MVTLYTCSSCLLLRYPSQNSLDESSQKHVPRPSGKEKPPYRNHQHSHRAFDVINLMRKYDIDFKLKCLARIERGRVYLIIDTLYITV